MTCPAGPAGPVGHASNTRRAYDGSAGDPSAARDPFITVRFAPSTCEGCALRARCVRAPGRGRQLALHPRAEHEALAAARARHALPAGRRVYAMRSGIEGTVSQAVQTFSLRRARYRRLAKTRLQEVATAAALNAARFDAWLAGRPLAPTRVSRFGGRRGLAPAEHHAAVARRVALE